jgi:hypothetical protein
MHRLTSTGGGAIEIRKRSDYTYVLAFGLCMAIVTATFMLFMSHGWGLLTVPVTFSWPQAHVLSTTLTAR